MIPTFQKIMLPLLRQAGETEQTVDEVTSILRTQFRLTDDEASRTLPNTQRTIFRDRIGWAKSYLKMAGLLTYPKRGSFVATDAGRNILKSEIKEIDIKFLRGFEEFRAVEDRRGNKQSDESTDSHSESSSTPGELVQSAVDRINDTLANELLDLVVKASPTFFEKLILKLLRAMGYGAESELASVQHLGGSGDKGVDGVVNQDTLGVDQIYIQAKRYSSERKVGSSQINEFIGALDGKKAIKGILITTSDFSKDAKDRAESVSKRIRLINGLELSNLMVEYGVGCREEKVYSIKKIEKEFFEEG